jgi:hypothetical protein
VSLVFELLESSCGAWAAHAQYLDRLPDTEPHKGLSEESRAIRRTAAPRQLREKRPPALPMLTAVFAVLSLPVIAQQAPLTIVENGVARCVIVAGPTLSPAEQFAVQELQNFIAQMSGAKLQVIRPGQAPSGEKPRAWLVVGKAAVEARHPGFDLKSLGSEGFAIKTSGDDLIIAGSETRGTLYGVYGFLDSLGCRWWSDDASAIPNLPTIRVPSTSRRQAPKMVYREALYQEQWEANLWGVRNRITNMVGGSSQIPAEWGGSGPVFHTNLVHSWRTLINLDGSLDYENKAGKADEKWYALSPDWQGKMQRVKTQPCTRNPQVREAIISGALKILREHPNDMFVTVGQEDGPDYCHCVEFGCADVVKSEGSASALVLDIANAVADRVVREFPGKLVMAPAYMWGLKMPKTLRPRRNMILSVAPIENDFGHPVATGVERNNVAFRAAMQEWAQTGCPIWVWDYTTNFSHYLMPHPNLDVLVENLRYYADQGVTGYMAQGSHTCINAEFSRLRMWVLARAMWNPTQSSRDLVKEFCDGYYGHAGTAVLRYIDTIHKPVRDRPHFRVSCYNDFLSPWLAPDVLVEAEGHMRAAEAAVTDNPVYLERVRLAHVPLQYVLAVRQPSSASWRQIESRYGKMDAAAFGANLADIIDRFYTKTGKPWGMDETGGIGFADFTAYLRQWAGKCAANGDALPPDLRDTPGWYRLIHPWQIDQQGMNWGNRPIADADASDGWVMRAKDEGWTASYRFVADDDFTVGKRYKLFVRVKCPPPMSEGDAFSCGIYGRAPLPTIEKTIHTRDLTPGVYQTFEIGTIALSPGHSFWICATKRNDRYAVAEARLDSLWLREAD